MAFAEELDGLMIEIMEKMKLEEMFTKANPMLKMVGQEASTMQIRNAVFLCAKHRENETIEFLYWLCERLTEILGNTGREEYESIGYG